MAKDLISCDRSLTALIQTQFENWSFLFEIIDDYQLTLANNPHAHPISYATMITDHVSRLEDTITITGTVSCIRGCGNRKVGGTFNNIERQIKRFKEEMLYSRDRFATITFPDFIFKYAVLTNATVENRQDTPQMKTVNLSFKGSNFGGLVQKPAFERGGVVI